VDSLRAIGCEVRVVAPVPWPKRRGRALAITPAESYPTYWYPPGMLRSHYHTAMQWSIGATLRSLTARWRPDAVLSFWTDPDGTVALQHARRLGVPGGVIAGGSDLMLLPSDPRRRNVIAATLRQADHVFAVGSVLVTRAVALGAPADRVSNFLAGVDLDHFGPGDRDNARRQLGLEHAGPLLLWIGSMVPVKATERLLEAAAELSKEYPGLSVALIGSGPREGALRAQVAAAPSLGERVRFVGAVDHAALPDWFRAADLFVLPSRSEGVPNVLLEALTSGLPFVASDVGSIRDLLPFGASRVVAEGDVNALTAGIRLALQANVAPPPPRPFDRLDGARHLVTHLGLGVA
jgi:glycosyltransferase involved in cell wall biosynthesis